jgi:glycosyltransferase involved in cell wall biosynthesis
MSTVATHSNVPHKSMNSSSFESVPQVSVCVISYNHAAFIERAVRSIATQETPFSFEIILADDCSTDGTKELAETTARQCAVPLRILPRTRNLGPKENFLDLLAAARGRYVAYLEGDDEWLTSSRLAEQVALLEAQPHLSGCFARAQVTDTNNDAIGDYFEYHRCPVPAFEVGQATAIARGSSAPSCTLMFRREPIASIPTWYARDGSHQGLSVLLTERGPLRFVDKVWGLYRVQRGGIWSLASHEAKYGADFRYAVALASDDELTRRYPREIGRRLALTTVGLSRERLRAGKGARSILDVGLDLRPIVRAPVLRALALALPGLARLAARRALV